MGPNRQSWDTERCRQKVVLKRFSLLGTWILEPETLKRKCFLFACFDEIAVPTFADRGTWSVKESSFGEFLKALSPILGFDCCTVIFRYKNVIFINLIIIQSFYADAVRHKSFCFYFVLEVDRCCNFTHSQQLSNLRTVRSVEGR